LTTYYTKRGSVLQGGRGAFRGIPGKNGKRAQRREKLPYRQVREGQDTSNLPARFMVDQLRKIKRTCFPFMYGGRQLSLPLKGEKERNRVKSQENRQIERKIRFFLKEIIAFAERNRYTKSN